MSAHGSDLEEGEIKDEAFEDISECSLSEILTIQEDLKDDCDLDQLREEALKSLQEKDEVTEEELYRFEALQSLLVNIEANEKKSKKRKRKKKPKEKTKLEGSKQKKLKKFETAPEHLSDSSLWSENSCAYIRNKENHMEGDSNLETRSWYPKSDFALLDIRNVDTSKKEDTEDFIPVPKALSPVVKQVKNVQPKVPQVFFSENVVTVSPNRSSQYASISKHYIRKFNNALPTANRSAPHTKKGKYKLVNASKYALKRNLKTDMTLKPNTVEKSKYSINRLTSKFPRLDPKDFVIELDEDSGNEEYDESNASLGQSSKIHSGSESNCSPIRAEKLHNDAVNITKTVAERDVKLQKCDSSIHTCDSSFSDIASARNMLESADTEHSLIAVGSRNISVSSTEIVNVDQLSDASSTPNISVSTVTTDADRSIDAVDVRSQSVSAIGTIDKDQPADAVGARSESVSSFGGVDTDRLTDAVNARSLSVSTTRRTDIDTPGTRGLSLSTVKTNDTELEKQTPLPSPTFLSVNTSLATKNNANEITSTTVITPIPCLKERKSMQNDKLKSTRRNEDTETEKVKKNAKEKDENDMKTSANNAFVLAEAEKCLVEVRTRLLSNLKDMEQRITRHDQETNKLNDMMKNLLTLKSMVLKLEDKIRLQKSRLATNTGSLQSLFRSITVRSQTCSQYKNVCTRAGTEVVGPQYNPPADYENLIEEKIKSLDFSKYTLSNTSSCVNSSTITFGWTVNENRRSD